MSSLSNYLLVSACYSIFGFILTASILGPCMLWIFNRLCLSRYTYKSLLMIHNAISKKKKEIETNAWKSRQTIQGHCLMHMIHNALPSCSTQDAVSHHTSCRGREEMHLARSTTSLRAPQGLACTGALAAATCAVRLADAMHHCARCSVFAVVGNFNKPV